MLVLQKESPVINNTFHPYYSQKLHKVPFNLPLKEAICQWWIVTNMYLSTVLKYTFQVLVLYMSYTFTPLHTHECISNNNAVI